MSETASAALFDDVAIETILLSIARLPDPDLILTQNGMGRHELRKLETDDEISAALETRRDAAISTPWQLVPYEGEAAEWLWETIEPFVHDILRGAWSAIPFGYSVMECVYSQGPRIGIAKVQEKPLEWFEPRRDGELWYSAPAGVVSSVYTGMVPVKVDQEFKFLCTRRLPTYKNPLGESLLTRLYWPWFFRQNGWRFWMQFLERFAAPLLLGQVHSPSEFVAAMQRMGIDSVIGVSTTETISAVTPTAAGEFEKMDNALSARIQKLILGQTLTSQMSASGGSFAAASVHNQVRDDKRHADCKIISATAQKICNALWKLNAFPGNAPVFTMQDETGLELARAERDSTLATAGLLTFTPKYFLDRYDYEEGDFIVPSTAVATPLSAKLAAPRTKLTKDMQMIEDLAGQALAEVKSPLSDAQIRSAIMAATSPDNLAERLAELYGHGDVAQFQDVLERALFTADVLGYAAAEQRIGDSV